MTHRLVGQESTWTTVVWDDPVNLMDYVTMVFMRYFGYPRERATQLMIQVHNQGRATVVEGSKDRDGGSRACDARLRFAGLGRKGRPRMRIEGTRNRWVWYLEHVEIIGIETALGHYVEALSRLRAAPAHSTTEGARSLFGRASFLDFRRTTRCVDRSCPAPIATTIQLTRNSMSTMTPRMSRRAGKTLSP